MNQPQNQPKFETEKAYSSYLEANWIDDVEDLMTEVGQGYFELLVEGLSRLFEADRVFIAYFDLDFQYGTTIADFNEGEACDKYDFFVPGTVYADIGRRQSVIIADKLQQFYPQQESLIGYRSIIGRPVLDENGSSIGLIVVLTKQPLPWIDAANGILDFCLGRIENEMLPLYKSRQLNEMNHQLLRELAQSNQLKEELSRLAYTDRVTNLPNREAFLVELKMIGDMASHWIGLFGVDFLKSVNDSMGLEYGDQLLRAIGQRLSEVTIPKLKVFKWTGDEFMVLGFAASETEMGRQLEACARVFDSPYDIHGGPVKITRSTGATPLARHETIDSAVKAVSAALHKAKVRGGNRTELFRESMAVVDTEFFHVHSMMQEGMRQRQFTPYYQPIFDPRTEKFVGYEALMRWIGSNGKSVFMPDQFIPIAERSGLIVDLGKEMIGTAVRNLHEWDLLHGGGRELSINLSPLQFHDKTLVQDIDSIVSQYDVDPSLIKFEITESLFVHEGDYVLEKLQDLKSIGCRLSLDDFGIGYSSLAYLQRYPFDQIKIDKCFIDNVLDSSKSRALIKAVRILSTDLGMNLVAEGVETEQQADCLTAIGVDYLQGYYFSRPMPPEQIDRTYADDWRTLHDPAQNGMELR
ncbi:MAG: diguanylate cyclase (GGDEF)-like protein [Candidatus Azotimanducaceae bacterium]|jgi:diguanylate cyclase (GGDEF)-like protein